MSTYKRQLTEFKSALADRRDELKLVTTDDRGRIILPELPYLTFPSRDSAEQFIRRVVLNDRKRRVQ